MGVHDKSIEVNHKRKKGMYRPRRVRYLLVVQHAERFGRHAVDAPIGVPVLIAYRDGEPAIVRPYQVDQLSLTALDLQCLALASVCGVVPLCNRKCDAFFSHFRLKLSLRQATIRLQQHVCRCAAVTRGESNVVIICAWSKLSQTASVAAASTSVSVSGKPLHVRKSWRIEVAFTDGITLLRYLIYSHGCIFAVYMLVAMQRFLSRTNFAFELFH